MDNAKSNQGMIIEVGKMKDLVDIEEAESTDVGDGIEGMEGKIYA